LPIDTGDGGLSDSVVVSFVVAPVVLLEPLPPVELTGGGVNVVDDPGAVTVTEAAAVAVTASAVPVVAFAVTVLTKLDVTAGSEQL
jgi:hypothetical protein